jgi:hypothetical protein
MYEVETDDISRKELPIKESKAPSQKKRTVKAMMVEEESKKRQDQEMEGTNDRASVFSAFSEGQRITEGTWKAWPDRPRKYLRSKRRL